MPVSEKARDFISLHIGKHLSEGMERTQAVAVAYNEAREKGFDIPRRRRD